MRALIVSAAMLVAPGLAAAPPIEDELALITPVGKSLSDPALAEFRKYAKQRWNVDVKTSALYDRLAAQNLLAPLELPKAVTDAIPEKRGKPKPILLKDPEGFWVGTVLESTGIVYHPRLLQRLGVPPPQDWDDLLDPRLKGQIAQVPPTRSSSSHAAYRAAGC